MGRGNVPVLEMGGGFFFPTIFFVEVIIQNAFGGLRCFFFSNMFLEVMIQNVFRKTNFCD